MVTPRVRHSVQDSGARPSCEQDRSGGSKLTRHELILGSAAVTVPMALPVSASSQQQKRARLAARLTANKGENE
jgi:hypothetical protein